MSTLPLLGVATGCAPSHGIMIAGEGCHCFPEYYGTNCTDSAKLQSMLLLLSPVSSFGVPWYYVENVETGNAVLSVTCVLLGCTLLCLCIGYTVHTRSKSRVVPISGDDTDGIRVPPGFTMGAAGMCACALCNPKLYCVYPRVMWADCARGGHRNNKQFNGVLIPNT